MPKLSLSYHVINYKTRLITQFTKICIIPKRKMNTNTCTKKHSTYLLWEEASWLARRQRGIITLVKVTAGPVAQVQKHHKCSIFSRNDALTCSFHYAVPSVECFSLHKYVYLKQIGFGLAYTVNILSQVCLLRHYSCLLRLRLLSRRVSLSLKTLPRAASSVILRMRVVTRPRPS